MNDCFRKDVDHLLSGLNWRQSDRARVLSALNEEEPKVKRKLSVGLVLAAVLVLLAAAALAWGLSYSPKAEAALTAREALMERYQLTQDMVRLFEHEETEMKGDQTITTYSTQFQTEFLNGEAMGVYTVVMDAKGNAEVRWSHDDVDPTAWQSADLTSPVWGAPQLRQMLNRWTLYQTWHGENVDIYEQPYDEQVKRFGELAALIAPLKLTDDEGPRDPETWAHRFDDQQEPNATPEVIPEATPAPTPRPGDITADQAIGIAREAMMSAYGMTEQEIDAYETEALFQFDGDGNCLVMFYGSYTMCHVELDAASGEIQEVVLDSNVGGNG